MAYTKKLKKTKDTSKIGYFSLFEDICSNFAIVFILILAFVLRIININQSLWLDEAIGAIAVKNFTFKSIITDFLPFDNHPPFYYLFLKLWTEIFSYSEMSLRMPSVIFGLLTIFFTYKICTLVFKGKTIGIISALLLTTSHFHIYYSQEARMYSMAGFFAAFSVYFLLKIVLNSHVHLLNYLLLSLGLCGLILTDYMPIFLLPFFVLIPILFKKDFCWWLKYLFVFILPFVCGVIWLPEFLGQSENGKWLMKTLPEWKNLAGGANLKQAILLWMKFSLGRISFANKLFYYFLVIAASIPFVFSIFNAFKQKSKNLSVFVLWLVIPTIFAFAASFIFPAFIYFRFMFVYPAFAVILATGITNISKRSLKRILLILVLCVNAFSFLIYSFDKNQQREDWKSAVSFVENNSDNTSASIFVYPQPFAPFRWYASGKISAFAVTNSIAADPVKTAQITEKSIRGKKTLFFFTYLTDLTDPSSSAKTTLENSGFVESDIMSFAGVGEILIYKK